MVSISIINGPNLNLTGQRETNIYGERGFDDIIKNLTSEFPQVNFSYFQSNVEGEIINALHHAATQSQAVIINAGAYTHSSLAIADAIRAISIPVVEVHLSNLLSREQIRHHSLTGAACVGSIMGFGPESYRLAVIYFLNKHALAK